MKLHQIILVTAFALTALTGCKKRTPESVCEDICTQEAECETNGDQSIGECTDECAEGLDGASKDCLKAFEEAGDCTAKLACLETDAEVADADCIGEALTAFIECPEIFEDSLGSSGGCCGETDTCNYAGDGICDCNGDAEWDAVDCQ